MATTLVSLEEYLSRTFHPDREYVDGAIVERNLGTQLHSRLRTQHPRHRIPDVMIVERPYRQGRVVIDVPAVRLSA